MSLEDTFNFQPELDVKASRRRVRKLMQSEKTSTRRALKPGVFIYTSYDAKNQEVVFDTTPMFLVLWTKGTHTLGLNLHWLPYAQRRKLVRNIVRSNKTRIKKGLPVEFNYQQIKARVKNMKITPCVRLYINSRFGDKCLVMPGNQIRDVIRLKTEAFSNGVSAEQMFKQMQTKNKKSKPKRKKIFGIF